MSKTVTVDVGLSGALDDVLAQADAIDQAVNEIGVERDDFSDDRIILNMGPQHPSTHGVLRLVVELEGETVESVRPVIGYLHTGIEKSCEYRTFTQGVTFITRCDYLSPTFNETAYCLAVENLLGIPAPPRAQQLRVLVMELTRISSHMVFLATGGMELGSFTGMQFGFREREEILKLMELITGARMNMAYVRPGGVSLDMPDGGIERVSEVLDAFDKRLPDYDKLLTGQPLWQARLKGIGYLPLEICMQLGITGPVLRGAGLGWDMRKTMPYCDYDTYDFEVPTATEADCFARYKLRLAEVYESVKICRQVLERLREPGPHMVDDPKVGWPARLTIGADGQGNSLEHIRDILGTDMEQLIHHFKLVTEGFHVPAGQSYASVEAPRGELGAHVVSTGGTRPHRVHLRDPAFNNLQALPAMCEGGLLADVVACVASLDPVLGGIDR